MVKNPPATARDAGDRGLIPELGRSPCGGETATHSSVLAGETPRTEEPGRYSPWGHKESDTTEHTGTSATSVLLPKEGQGRHN